MSARRTLMQLATKLAIGLGALFLVGVLLAAIPNHHAPVVQGVSVGVSQEAQGTDHSTAPGMRADEATSHEKNVRRDSGRDHPTAPKAGGSTK